MLDDPVVCSLGLPSPSNMLSNTTKTSFHHSLRSLAQITPSCPIVRLAIVEQRILLTMLTSFQKDW